MNVWDLYESRISSRGSSQREVVLRREQNMLSNKIPNNLSYHHTTIDGIPCDVAIINSDNLNEKTILAIDKKIIRCGSMVEWMNNHWIIIELDANDEVYQKAKMLQCNYLLKWIDDSGKICEQWCVIEDGTKYLTGEYEDRNFVVTRGDSRIAMTIAKNSDTIKFKRECRFLVGDPDSDEKLSYLLTKPLKVGMIYGGEGVYSFVLQEVVSTDDDNHILGIADYYKYFPRELDDGSKIEQTKTIIDPENTTDTDGRKVWL